MEELNRELVGAVSGGSWMNPQQLHYIDHVVKEGETLQSIADFYGTTEAEIAKRNHLANPQRLAVGKILKIAATRNYN